MAALTAEMSPTNRLPAESAASMERALLWAFIAGLAWCPFWFGSAVLLAWGINAVLFPGVVVIYEVSLLMRRKPHPVADWANQATRGAICRRRAVDLDPECHLDP